MQHRCEQVCGEYWYQAGTRKKINLRRPHTPDHALQQPPREEARHGQGGQ